MVSQCASALHVGQVLEIDFPTFRSRINIHSDRDLTVEIVAGDNMGFCDMVEYEAVEVRDGLVVLSWREHIGSTIVHVLDLISGKAHTAVTPVKGDFMRLTGRITMRPERCVSADRRRPGTAAIELFPGFASGRLGAGNYEIFFRIGGSGPPLLLLHGYPETHVCWHKIAPGLAARFTVVVADLPGYGESRGPEWEAAYAKRAMAEAFVGVMNQLGYPRFSIAGHDRGGRVAYRLALDCPDRVERLATLSILPTFAMWQRLKDNADAMRAFRWYFLAQPSPFPEDMIEAFAIPYLHATLSGWTADKSLAAFAPDALAAYETAFATRAVIAGSCADYRTGWTKDREDDEDDLAAGRVIACPTLALWGRREFPDVERFLAGWRPIAPHAEGHAMDCGHFLPEEEPDKTAEALSAFLVRDSHLPIS